MNVLPHTYMDSSMTYDFSSDPLKMLLFPFPSPTFQYISIATLNAISLGEDSMECTLG